MALLVPVLFLTGIVIWDVYFSAYTTIEQQQDRRPHPFPGGDRGDHRLDHPCLCGDLGQGFGAGDDAGLRDPGLGLAASSQMAAAPGSDRLGRDRGRMPAARGQRA